MSQEKQFFISRSNMYASMVEIHLSEMRYYLKQMEENIIESKKRLDTYFTQLKISEKIAQAEKESKTDELDYWEYCRDDLSEKYHSLVGFQPHSFRSAFIIQMYSFLEFHLKEICKMVHEVKNPLFRVDEIQGYNDLERSKTYLKKVANIDFQKLNLEWNFVNIVRKVRNSIVHHGGHLEKSKSNFLRDTIGITLTEIKNNEDIFQIEFLDSKFCYKAINKIQNFFQKLLIKEMNF